MTREEKIAVALEQYKAVEHTAVDDPK